MLEFILGFIIGILSMLKVFPNNSKFLELATLENFQFSKMR